MFKISKPAQDPSLLGLERKELVPLFDGAFYKAEYPDVAKAKVDPLSHYIEYGWREHRSPFAGFDLEYYRLTHMDGDTETCPLAHYVKIGLPRKLPFKDEKSVAFRQWRTSRDEQWTKEMFRLLEALGIDTTILSDLPLGRYLKAMFSADYYREVKGCGPEVDDNECFVRYVAFGLPNGMAPGPFFDEATYRRRAAEAGLPPIRQAEGAFVHWMRHGLPRDISPSPLFSPHDYVALNKDLEVDPNPKVEHFLLHGITERRQFSKETVVTPDMDDGTRKNVKHFFDKFGTDIAAHHQFEAMRRFRNSGHLRKLVAKAREIEPDITTNVAESGLLPPWHDTYYVGFRRALEALPEGKFNSVVLIPFCKVGGADYLAGILSRTLSEIDGPVLVIQTDQTDFARPAWFAGVERIDLSEVLQGLDETQRTRVLYEVLRHMHPENVFNVNSRLTFDTFVRFGSQLSTFTRLHAYYFCADRTPEGDETGYPVWYFASIFAYLTSAITDSADLSNRLAGRYCLPPEMAGRVRTLYTPAKITAPEAPVVEEQVATAVTRKRPALIWAGRFDRQKRFDLLLDVARELPGVDFMCWGKAVLDEPPDLSDLPGNVILHEPFTNFDELPLEEVDGFFYTSDWDGIPTILIELGGFGMPIVASGAGGVPELIDHSTGWVVPVGSKAEEYAQVIEEMLAAPSERVARALALRERVRDQHGVAGYTQSLNAILKGAST